MALIRQMPQLYLRGSLVNITMAGLTPAQRILADTITDYVVEHKEMSKHKHQMVKELGSTIGADYRDDRECGLQEFRIAVWRGVVNLFFHKRYTFECKACGQSKYLTKRQVWKPIDRLQTPCPHCGQVRITKTGCSPFPVGSYVTHAAFQESYRYVPSYRWYPHDILAPSWSSGNRTHYGYVIWGDARYLVRFRKHKPEYPRQLTGAVDVGNSIVAMGVGPEAEQINVGIDADPTTTTNFVSYCRMRRSQFTKLADPATYELPEAVGQPVDYESANVLTMGEDDHLAYPVWVLDPPECETTIEAIGGAPYYPNPNDVINDSKQMVKFFGEFVWNYFRQQLRENSRTEHHREPQEIVGRADEIIVDEIVALCAKLKIDCSFCAETQPENGWYHIQVNGLQTPPEFSGELIMLLAKAKSYDIHVVINDLDIRVRENASAPMISTFVVKPEHVMVLDNSISVSDDSDDGAFTINQVSFRTIGAQRMDQEDHVLTIERTDVVRAIRNALPEGDCRRILELLQQTGDTYEAFRTHQGGLFNYDGTPRQQHMAQFLNITPRAVKNHVTTIRHICHTQGFSPINYR